MEKPIKVLVIIFILAIPSWLGFVHVKRWHKAQLTAATQQTENDCLGVVADLETRISLLQEELTAHRAVTPTPETMSTIFGENTPPLSWEAGEVDCDETNRRVMALFSYMDEQKYLPAHDMDMPFHGFFNQMTIVLSTKAPLLTGELEDILSLLRNVTHFYRILGKNRLKLMKEIVVNETEIIEPAFAILFNWATTCPDQYTASGASLIREDLYNYAGYFLNTLGGRSYLLRRESKIRILVSYYSILILDIANDEKLNRVGIDIRPHIDFLFYDIINQTGWMYKEQYLSELAALRGKYQY
ncbi:MAG: hypothetical protein HKM93_03430 [Desulfobacteraceae bacterium]|nr:hypothetical protein [Desulfobacteraceae bacterium]